jgi:hypothetical protein
MKISVEKSVDRILSTFNLIRDFFQTDFEGFGEIIKNSAT